MNAQGLSLAALLTATLLAALLAATLLATASLLAAPATPLFVAITLLAATALFVTITIALLTAAALLAPSLPGACGFARLVRITFCFHDYLSLFYMLSLLIGLSHFATRPFLSPKSPRKGRLDWRISPATVRAVRQRVDFHSTADRNTSDSCPSFS
jgi:hypothetical protein